MCCYPNSSSSNTYSHGAATTAPNGPAIFRDRVDTANLGNLPPRAHMHLGLMSLRARRHPAEEADNKAALFHKRLGIWVEGFRIYFRGSGFRLQGFRVYRGLGLGFQTVLMVH